MRLRLLTLFLALAGCAAPEEQSVEPSAYILPTESYLAAAARGADVYRVVPEESLLLVRVGRAGPARELGHDHVVASEKLSGYIECGSDRTSPRADLAFRVSDLIVDKADYRTRFGLDTSPSAEDIAGTRDNMMKVLEPDLYPWVAIQAGIAAVQDDGPEMSVSVTLHGSTAAFQVPARIELQGPRLIAGASATVKHSDFGIEPFSVMGGLLRVADALVIDLRLVAEAIGRENGLSRCQL